MSSPFPLTSNSAFAFYVFVILQHSRQPNNKQSSWITPFSNSSCSWAPRIIDYYINSPRIHPRVGTTHHPIVYKCTANHQRIYELWRSPTSTQDWQNACSSLEKSLHFLRMPLQCNNSIFHIPETGVTEMLWVVIQFPVGPPGINLLNKVHVKTLGYTSDKPVQSKYAVGLDSLSRSLCTVTPQQTQSKALLN